MTTIVVNADFRAKLVAAGGLASLVDENGILLGRFVAHDNAAVIEEFDIGLTADELESRLAPDCKTYSTAEVLAHLRGLK